MTKTAYPEWICHDCGVKHGGWYSSGKYSGPSTHSATYHIGTCQCCGKESTPVTESRDYGHFNQWPSIDRKPKKPKTQADLIDYVIDEFNFERISTAMRAVNWKWACGDNSELEIPSVETMQDKARELLTKATKERESDYHAVGTGGLLAESDDEGLSLSFVFARSEVSLSDFND